MNISARISTLLNEIKFVKEASQSKEDILVVAVTKGCSVKAVLEAYACGIRDFGESRVQEALSKIEQAPQDIRWHFIGKLQANKINKVVGVFSLIHSVDSADLAEKISKASERKGIITPILLQANTSGEQSKGGYTSKRWKEAFTSLLSLRGVRIEGLMTMAPLTDDENAIRNCFAELRYLRDALQEKAQSRAQLRTLSMGMSNDFRLAIREGASLLRIGSAFFSNTLE